MKGNLSVLKAVIKYKLAVCEIWKVVYGFGDGMYESVFNLKSDLFDVLFKFVHVRLIKKRG